LPLKGLSAYGLSGFIFESLTDASLDEPFSQYGHLVEDIELAEDKLSVTFRLDKNARFSDGSAVTAEDVKFSFETLISDKSFPLYRFYYADVKNAEVLDQQTIRFNFRNVNAELHMILGQIAVFSRLWVGDKSFDQVITDIPIASGPYVVDSFEVGSYITYKRDPDYWAANKNTRKGMYNFDRITVKYYKDTGIAREALKAGEFDFYLENTSKSWATDYKGERFRSGKILTRELSHSNNAGMQGFIFNLRREQFQDKRVRQAISLAFDFEWSNEKLFYGQYTPVDSYYSNSELAARGKASGLELAFLEEFREYLPASVFAEKQTPVSTAPPSSIRKNLIKAKRLLDEAGWTLGKDGVLKKDKGLRLEIDFMLAQKGFEKIVAPFAHNLKRLGIKMNYRTVDTSLYQRRVESFDFDMITSTIQQSQSPGNEQRDFFHSEVADVKGSRNRIGVREPVVDALIDKIIYATNRAELVAATRALDRVLWDGNYVVPNWYIKYHRIAYWDKFGFPETLPLYYQATSYMQSTWWSKDAQ